MCDSRNTDLYSANTFLAEYLLSKFKDIMHWLNNTKA